ncbi:hypothetical protein NQ314_009669 [Rhamnusium bicolor]|uniref:Protein ARV n=1 Tax=Rhamnusium bicolor TaxID=1586634 RepID=A0AAV8XX54_9CUCU|nr:hypothetical protein NQ314_009669 [Rhamnusium bicolor]
MTEEGKEYICINCGRPVKNLYKKYSDTVLKLTECDVCNSIADKYVEYDTVVIIIDLILLRAMAYKHILLNSEFKNFWKLSIILLLLETYSNWTIETRDKRIEVNDTKPYLVEADIYLEDFKFYKLCFNITINTLCFVMMIYIFTMIYSFLKYQATISFLMIYKTVTLSSTGIFLFLPSLVWDISVHEFHLHFITIYTTLSQLLAYKALCNCEKIWSLLVIFSGILLKTSIGDSFGNIEQFVKNNF